MRLQPLVMALAALFVSSFSATAQELEIPISPSPVGSGARAAGMADAFVAIADDATAASWNPAGLVQLERPEMSFVSSFNALNERFSANFHPEVDSTQTGESLNLNFLSIVYPLPPMLRGRNAVVSLSYQQKFDLSRNFKLNLDTASIGGSTVSTTFQTIKFDQSGGLSAITPAFAIELTHKFSVGVAINFWRSTFISDNSWEQKTSVSTLAFGGNPTLISRQGSEEYEDFSGENYTLGLLWNATQRLTIGLRYDSAFTGKAKYKSQSSGFRVILATPSSRFRLLPTATSSKENREIRFPDSLALGMAIRVNDRLTISMDVTRTDWNDFYVKDAAGTKTSLVDGNVIGAPLTATHMDPTYTVRFGTEYVFIPKQPDEDMPQLWTLRGGIFYDEEPATNRSTRNTQSKGNGKPDRFYGVTFGVGLLARQRFNFDFAYQFRYGPGVNSDFIRGLGGFEEDVMQHRALLSTVVYF